MIFCRQSVDKQMYTHANRLSFQGIYPFSVSSVIILKSSARIKTDARYSVYLGCVSASRRELSAMKGELYIKEKRCKGCGICAAFCPKKVLEVSLLGKITPVRPEDCIACGQCEMRCPDFAIFVERRA